MQTPRPPIAVMWFRNDLRLTDNPALHAALNWASDNNGTVLPIYILDDVMEKQLGGATRWWLEQSLSALATAIAAKDSTTENQPSATPLHLFRDNAQQVISRLRDDHDIAAIFWNRSYDPQSVQRDSALKNRCRDVWNLPCESFNSHLLFEPWQVKTGAGTSFKVFSPFWRACLKMPPPARPQPAPKTMPLSAIAPENAVTLAKLALSPTPVDWAEGLAERFTPGEQAARDQLHDFIDDRLVDYADLRDRPDHRVTSELSPHLRFGEISPREIWHALSHHAEAEPGHGKTASKFLSELGWREFAHHVLFHADDLRRKPLQAQFAQFPWRESKTDLQAWQRGQTGYPIVDAGMRELWHTGYMHNRVRMIVGSLLVKHLLQHWQHGLEWFDDTLVDACPAADPFSWQWIGGSGADAAPYFRIFNPVLQGEKFDSNGDYVRQWVPELRDLPTAHIHKPWEAPPLILQGAGVKLGQTYPKPIVDLKGGRDRAMNAYREMKAASTGDNPG
ncbi:cryptochrome/photolyase family protein [Thalassospira mesophila]|uniref:Deoxyribodipyrimidine photo-lyase n=1 Tax=Thalassospira mesophila TaxID=1293891 RepID=A0A1Y2KZU6_9PROT|nr:deoxyribodipyrimidine photo-lyase [Thalassospira mesophila]OSQ38353.1 deoxyribodipyrimidine photolyase [Thalassospira mesophila]